ncbi:MAG: hypothetical protein WC977_01365 [Anaerovoracaceae bacterium]|jgi:hypothetical protein
MATTTPKISIYEMDAWNGRVPAWRNEIVTRERPGVDGYTLSKLGKRAPAFEVTTRKTYADRGAAESAATAFGNLCGQFVTIREPGGRSHSHIVVLDVVPIVKPLGVSTDGNSYLVEATWRLQRAGGG